MFAHVCDRAKVLAVGVTGPLVDMNVTAMDILSVGPASCTHVAHSHVTAAPSTRAQNGRKRDYGKPPFDRMRVIKHMEMART